jgi:hypothetical protein
VLIPISKGRAMRPLSHTLAAVGTVALASTLLAAPASAKPAITLTPSSLPRGADVSVPHVDGHTVVDGTVRITIDRPQVRLLGKSGTAYVVGTMSESGRHGRIWRFSADGGRTLLARAHPFMSILSHDGAILVTTENGGTASSVITAYDVATATFFTQHLFRDYAVALDANARQVAIGTTKKTVVWTLPPVPATAGSVATLSHDPGYIADLAAGVVGTFTKDPYDGGCSVVTRITTGERLWRSCTEQVAAFNADASRIATIGILSDGPGPGRVDARTIDGKHLGRYQVASGWFGSIGFETQTGLLLEVNGARKAFTARCIATVCERASKLRPAEVLRTS